MSLLLLLTSCLPVLTSARVNVVLVGATGELADKHLLPAFFDQINMDNSIYLFPSATIDGQDGKTFMNGVLAEKLTCFDDEEAHGGCAEQKQRIKDNVLPYMQLEPANELQWQELAKVINNKMALSLDEETGRLVYLSISPNSVVESANYINKHLRPAEGAWLRVVIEQPFGTDEQRPEDMASEIAKHLKKEEVYRNDHFLSKAGLRALHDLDTLSPDLKNRLHRHNLKRVEVGLYQTEGVVAHSYDKIGVIRDVMQSHVTEMAVAAAMHPVIPDESDHRDVKNEFMGVIRSGKITQHYVAQYEDYNHQLSEELGEAAGHDESEEADLVDEEGDTRKSSSTPTFALVTVYFDDGDRWKGVPFMLTSGKKMPTDKAFVRFVLHEEEYIEVLVDSGEDDANTKIRSNVNGGNFSFDLEDWTGWQDDGLYDGERVLSLQGYDKHDTYWYVVAHALAGDRTKFVDDDDLKHSLDLWDSVLEEIEEEHEDGVVNSIEHYGPGGEIEAFHLTDIDFIVENILEGGFDHEEEEHDEL